MTRGHPAMRGHFLRTVSNLPHVKEPVMKGHLSCRDTFSRILRCPLKTGFTVDHISPIMRLVPGRVYPGTILKDEDFQWSARNTGWLNKK